MSLFTSFFIVLIIAAAAAAAAAATKCFHVCSHYHAHNIFSDIAYMCMCKYT